jgi:hypothetical protein
MAKLGLFFLIGILLGFAASCGNDSGKEADSDTGANDSDTRSDMEGDTDTHTDGDTDTDTDGDTDTDTDGDTDTDTDSDSDADGDTDDVEGLAACTGFTTATAARLKECDNPLADAMTEQVMTLMCTTLCETEGQTVTRADYDACIDYATSVLCENIPGALDSDAGSLVPEACGFMHDTLNCQF